MDAARPLPRQQQQPPSLPGLIFFLAFLFFINSTTTSLAGPDPTDLPLAGDGLPGAALNASSNRTTSTPRTPLVEFEAYLAGNESAWLPADPSPETLLAALSPPRPALDLAARYATNITGFVRHERAVSFNLTAPVAPSSTATRGSTEKAADDDPAGRLRAYLAKLDLAHAVFHPVDSSNLSSPSSPSNGTDIVPSVLPARNETLAASLRGSFPWVFTSPRPQSIWTDPTAPSPLLNASLLEPQEHALALTLHEGWWGHAYNHPSAGGVPAAAGGAAHEWTNVKGTLDLTALEGIDGAGGEGSQSWTVQGLHHRPNGTVWLRAEIGSPDPDIRDLPGLFAPGSVAHADVLRFVRREMVEDDARAKRQGTKGRLMSDDLSVVPAQTKCPLWLVLQLAPLDPSLSPADLALAEAEAQNPTGLPTRAIDVRLAGGVWWSWECGVAGVLEGSGKVVRAESFWRSSVNYAFGSLVAQGTILALMVWQMERTRAPAQLAKIAMGGISMQCALDGAVFVGHVMVGIVVGRRTLALMGTAFLALLSCAMFGPRWLVTIKITQESERVPTPAPVVPPPPAARPAGPVVRAPLAPPPRRGEAVGQPPAFAPTPAPVPPPATTATPAPPAVGAPPAAALPAPATAPAPPPVQAMPGTLPRSPANAPPPQEAPSPVVMGMFLFLILLQTNLIPLFFPVLVFALHAWLVPQIVRNASRGTRRALSWRYVFGTAAARTWYGAYFASGWWRDNVLFLERSGWFTAIVVLQVVQLLVLALQDFVSSTFFLPARFAPPAPYDYHPLLPPSSLRTYDDRRAEQEKDVERDGGEDSWEKGDCAICMEPLLAAAGAKGADDLGAAALGGSAAAAAGLKSREWALAPCHHVFHTACLEPWMAIRSVCPQCRRPLPPMS